MKRKVRSGTARDQTEHSSVGSRVQSMSFPDQALVLSRLAEARSESKGFAASELQQLFYDCFLPPPKNLHDVVLKLRKKGFLTTDEKARLRLSPWGRQRSAELLSGMDLSVLIAESTTSSPVVGSVTHALVPAELAPPHLVQSIGQFLRKHPFETNVFGMTRFPSSGDGMDPDPVAPALEAARQACSEHGLEFHLASDRAINDDLWTNVMAHMWASQYGIAFFEDRKGKRLNYNLTIEVGGMLVTGRRCALLKDKSIEKLPTDLVGQIYKSVDLDKPTTVSEALHKWMSEDLGLGRCPRCK